eukprot:6124078-Amphidinium_carterae.1
MAQRHARCCEAERESKPVVQLRETGPTHARSSNCVRHALPANHDRLAQRLVEDLGGESTRPP